MTNFSWQCNTEFLSLNENLNIFLIQQNVKYPFFQAKAILGERFVKSKLQSSEIGLCLEIIFVLNVAIYLYHMRV